MGKEELKVIILEEIKRRMPDFKKTLGEIIRIPTDNPPGDTKRAIDFIADRLRAKGIKVDIYEPKPNNPNIVSYIKGIKEGPNLVLNGHIDQFPAGDEKYWSYNPYSGECKDGKILGRGSADMKGGLAASLLCYELIHELSIPVSGQLTLTVVSDEETGGKWGAQWLLENVSITRGDSLLNGEPSGLDSVRIGHKGSFWLRIRTSDLGGHGALPGEENAITKSMKIGEAIRKLRGWKIKTPIELMDIIEVAKDKLEKKPYGKGRGWVFDSTTVNIGVIRGGDKVNVIPMHCEMEIDIRIPNGISMKDLQEKITNTIKETGLKLDDISMEWFNTKEPSYSLPTARIIQLVNTNARKITGEEAELTISFAGSDCRFWQYRGIPIVMYGPTPYNMAAADEYILEKDFEQVLKVHAATIIDYLCE